MAGVGSGDGAHDTGIGTGVVAGTGGIMNTFAEARVPTVFATGIQGANEHKQLYVHVHWPSFH